MENLRFKFRVWDKEKELLVYDVENCFDDWDCQNFYDYIVKDRYIVEQCTGLKDKNGKLIYEGDIVYSPLDSGTQKVIYWDDGLASFMAYNRYPDKHYTQRIGDGYFIELGFEVIGNIHTNADLLEIDND